MDRETLFEMSADQLEELKPLKTVFDLTGKVAVVTGDRRTCAVRYPSPGRVRCQGSILRTIPGVGGMQLKRHSGRWDTT